MSKKRIRPKTLAQGGNDERDLVKKFIRRLKRQFGTDADTNTDEFLSGARQVIYLMQEWLIKQPRRTRRPGGLGR